MNYLNIHTDLLRSVAYLGADPIERATWLNLMGWCAAQENGGMIMGAAEWKDRRWQQICGITKEEATLVSDLYHFDDDGNMIVTLYPAEKEAEVKAKRLTAKANGKKGGRPKKTPPPETDKKPTAVNFEKAEGKGREGNGKEEKKEDTPSLPIDSRIYSSLREVFPKAVKTFSEQERASLTAEVVAVLDDLTADDWLANQCWFNKSDERGRGCKLWPRNRCEYFDNIFEAQEKISTWWEKKGRQWWQKKNKPRHEEVPPEQPNIEDFRDEYEAYCKATNCTTPLAGLYVDQEAWGEFTHWIMHHGA